MRPTNPDSDTLRPGSGVVLRRGDQCVPGRVRSVRRNKQFFLVGLENCDSMDAAQALVGSELCVDEDDLPPTGPSEVYVYQLVGMTAVTTAGERIGTVEDVLETPANDICVVRGAGREQLVPLVPEFVVEVDHVNRRLVVAPIPGLLED